MTGRIEILSLYRAILKGRRKFKYTQSDYYTRRVREEFKKNKDLADPKIIERCFSVGTRMVENNWGDII